MVLVHIPMTGLTANAAVLVGIRKTKDAEPVYTAPMNIDLSTSPPVVTVPLWHFTSLHPIGLIFPGNLEGGGVSAPFSPTDDGWPQPNDARYGGNGDCFGMSLFAILYRLLKGPGDPDLSDLLLNSPLRAQKLRFVAHLYQLEALKFWKEVMTNEMWQSILGMNANARARAVLFALWITGRPQTLILWKAGDPPSQHAVVVKGYDAANKRFVIYDPNYPGQERYISWDAVNGWTPYDGYTYFYLDFSEQMLLGDAGKELRKKFVSYLNFMKRCIILTVYPVFPAVSPPSGTAYYEEMVVPYDANTTPAIGEVSAALDGWEIPYVLDETELHFIIPVHSGLNRLSYSAHSVPFTDPQYGAGEWIIPCFREVEYNIVTPSETCRFWLMWDNPEVNLDLWVGTPGMTAIFNYAAPTHGAGGIMQFSDVPLSTAAGTVDGMQEMFACLNGGLSEYEALPGSYSLRVGYRSGAAQNPKVNWTVIAMWGGGPKVYSSMVKGHFDGPGSAPQDAVGFASGGDGWSDMFIADCILGEVTEPFVIERAP